MWMCGVGMRKENWGQGAFFSRLWIILGQGGRAAATESVLLLLPCRRVDVTEIYRETICCLVKL
jgi:hypothetical protein